MLFVHVAVWALAATTPEPLDVAGCVRWALEHSPKITEAEASLREYQARLAEVESIYYPKLQALGFVAPMYTVRGSALQNDVERRWKSVRDWGPYTRLESTLALPLYTFGRAEAGEDAARERAEVERARVREARQVLATEVRHLYFQRLFALSMLPALKNASGLIATAATRAEALFQQGTGEVTQVDVAKLKYVEAELGRYQLEADGGAALALSALKHTMGMPDDAHLALADSKLPSPSDAAPPADALAGYMRQAAQNRPEWAQLEHGERAAVSWREAEELANLPVLFLAGQFNWGWTPQRTDSPNPYHYDPYNQVFGGVALGFRYDLDWAKTGARAEQAEATSERLAALRRFAATGIPLQVRKAFDEVDRFRSISQLGAGGVKNTRKWMTFAAAAYASGTGDARDLVEGLVAYLQAKSNHYESVLKYHLARADLVFAVGSDTM